MTLIWYVVCECWKHIILFVYEIWAIPVQVLPKVITEYVIWKRWGETGGSPVRFPTCLMVSARWWSRGTQFIKFFLIPISRFVLKFGSTSSRHLLISIQTLVSSPTMPTSLLISFNLLLLASNMQPCISLRPVSVLCLILSKPCLHLSCDLKSVHGIVCQSCKTLACVGMC